MLHFFCKYLMMEEGASGGNPEKPAVDGGPGSEGGGAAAEPKAALTEEVNGSGAELGRNREVQILFRDSKLVTC